ncbi:hypothetical protein [Streptomyces sp. NPDC058671]|uniref:hypothetical protein n=1 Tax=Streptomyces sp. NPDC058671 TaxID=3346590 RepID=UPI00364DE4B3
MTISGPGTIDDLVHDAALAGHAVTKRLVHDWVSLGLLDRPQRRRTGPHGSDKALHSVHQRKLFQLLLGARVGTPRIPLLARIPLTIWLYGESGAVPTRQALRALVTHVGDPRGSKPRALETARFLIAPLDDRRLGTAHLRREFLHAVRDALYTGSFDGNHLLAKARPLFEPPELHRQVVYSRGLTAARTPETLIFEVRVKMLGGRVIAEGGVSLADLEAIRELWLSMPPFSREGMLNDVGLPTAQAIETSGNWLVFSLGAQALSKHWSEAKPNAHRGSHSGKPQVAPPHLGSSSAPATDYQSATGRNT